MWRWRARSIPRARTRDDHPRGRVGHDFGPVGPGRGERLNRGVVSVHTGDGDYVGWRVPTGDAPGTAFNLCRDGVKVNAPPITGASNHVDRGVPADAEHVVRAVVGGVEQVSAVADDPAVRFTECRLRAAARGTRRWAAGPGRHGGHR
ncbi:rhamnogalacturonan endolyase family protein [Actinosynnema sp. NPDC004786]